MAELGGFLAFIGMMMWMGVGGWAFRRLGPETSREALGGLFVGCLLLAPFAAGAAVADRARKEESQ